MAHKFDRTDKDPYVQAAHHLEASDFSSAYGYKAGAEEEMYGRMADVIVTALGDIAAEAYKLGINEPEQMKGLAQAVAHTCEAAFTSYRGEVSALPVIQAIQNDPRVPSLSEQDRYQLDRQIERTRDLEELILSAYRLPWLIDFAGSLGLSNHEDALDNAELIVPGETPTGPGAAQLGARPTADESTG